MIMKENVLLKEYVGLLLIEGGFIRSLDKKSEKRSNSLLQKIKTFFLGDDLDTDQVAYDWLKDQASFREIEFNNDFEDEVRSYASLKKNRAMKRSRNDSKRAESLLRRALDARFAKQLDRLEIIQNNIDNEI